MLMYYHFMGHNISCLYHSVIGRKIEVWHILQSFSLLSFKIQYLLVLLLAHIHTVSECYPVPLFIYPLLYPIITATFLLQV